MENIVNIKYESTGNSTNVNNLGMREMQERAYQARNAQYLLLKAPPASGKSRALMFIALDKLTNQHLNKAIVAVPERAIAGSFSTEDLKSEGFFENWSPSPEYNLCIPGGETSKVSAFHDFLSSEERILICTHATLRFAFNAEGPEKFNNCLIAIDEFHHVSADYENKLGELIRALMSNSNAHLLAMTGSYFRGDSVPVLMPEDEAKFYKVTYNYYEQLNGYKYLKSLGIGYHFYQGRYTTAIGEVLDTDKKTILHIPNVNSGESTKDKLNEVDEIIDIVGRVIKVDDDSKIIHVRRPDGKELKVADLVNETQPDREKTISYLRNIKSIDDVDLIIALNMAKEGFDWTYCEHALTVGYRGSLTEIIQIIGRCTRDSPNKVHAQFTNLIAEPDAEDESVAEAVNNMLKALTASLLMEQVLAPKFEFKSKSSGESGSNSNREIMIKGFKEPSTKRVQNIVGSGLTDLKATILQDPDILKAIPGIVDPEVVNQIMIPKVIKIKYPDLDENQIEELRQQLVAEEVLKHAEIKQDGNMRFIQLANNFINIEDIDIDLIDKINPFQNAFEVLSKSVTPRVLKAIQECIAAFKVKMTDDEASYLWPKINNFVRSTGRDPNLDSIDPTERRLAEAIIYLKQRKRSDQLPMNKKEKIEDIFRNDPFSLLETEKASTTGSRTEDQRLIESFGSISNFYEEHGREPLSKHFAEFRLHARLKALRNDPKKIKLLLPYDFHNLLQADVNKSYSVDEIVKDDPLGILDDNKESEDIFQLKHVTKSNRIRPDYISHRKVCPDFDEYESMFNCLHEELKKGNRKLVEFNEKDVEVGRFYVLNGVVLYLANADTVVKSESFNSGNRKRLDGRTRCIFDNGTESEMLLRSLNKALQLDGFGISELLDLNNPKTTIEGDDRQNGFIYILRSKSRDPQISKKSDLYKIGYSTGDVTQRIKNAPHEPTYLMSNVEIVSMFRCYNLSTGKLESTIHGFFNEVRCEIQVTDNEGKVCNPREWFVAPIEVIEEAVTLIVNNKIHSYRYSPNTRKIILKEL